MSTYMPKAAEVERSWYILDAADKPLGKEVGYDKLMKENPEKAMTIAVNGMLPNTTLGRKALTRLRCYAGAEHNNAAQKPVEYKI